MKKLKFLTGAMILLLSLFAQAQASDDSALLADIHAHRGADFVEAGGMTVSRLLQDDTKGLQHQKWLVKLSDGSQVLMVYNIDMEKHIPLNIGDKVSAGGQLIITDQGPLLHWLHYDPKGHRPDGYVEVNGQVYGGAQN